MVAPSFFTRRIERNRWESPQPTIPRHLFQPRHRLQGAQQNASCLALHFAGDVHAIVAAVNRVNIGMPSRPEEHAIPWRRAAMRVRRRIGRLVVRAQVRLDLDNPAGQISPARVLFTSNLPRSRGATRSAGASKNARSSNRPGIFFSSLRILAPALCPILFAVSCERGNLRVSDPPTC